MSKPSIFQHEISPKTASFPGFLMLLEFATPGIRNEVVTEAADFRRAACLSLVSPIDYPEDVSVGIARAVIPCTSCVVGMGDIAMLSGRVHGCFDSCLIGLLASEGTGVRGRSRKEKRHGDA